MVRDRQHREGPASFAGATQVGNFSEQVWGSSDERHHREYGTQVAFGAVMILRYRVAPAGMVTRSTKVRPLQSPAPTTSVVDPCTAKMVGA